MQFSDLLSFFKQAAPGIPGERAYDSKLCRILTHASLAEAASVWRVDDQGRLCLSYATNANMADTSNFFLEVGEGISGAVALSQKTIAVHQTRKDSRHSRRLDGIIGFQTKSMISAPIISKARLYGVINILNQKTGVPFPEQWKERLTVIGLLYGDALSLAAHARTSQNKFIAELKPSPRLVAPGKTVVVGISSGIQNALGMALKAGKTDIPVLIYGETGTGKELIARRVHEAAMKKDQPFLAVN